MVRCLCALFTLFAVMVGSMQSTQADDRWVVYEGGNGPGKGKHIVFVTGDDEYRSEEGMPMMAKILSVRHGFKCTVLFAIDPKTGEIRPNHQTNIPGTEALNDADLMVVFLRFRNLPDEQMKPIAEFTHSGKPIIGLRTATHSFNIPGDSNSSFKNYSWRAAEPKGGFGQHVLGDTWISHHGAHKSESTRGVINEKFATHPVLRGVKDVWGPTDVYGIRNLRKDDEVLLYGSVLKGMKPTDEPVEGKKNDPMMPVAWIRHFKTDSGKTARVFNTTMGASVDLESADLRRMLVNAVFWGLEMEDSIDGKANVDYVGEYKPTMYGFGNFKKGVKPSDHTLARK